MRKPIIIAAAAILVFLAGCASQKAEHPSAGGGNSLTDASGVADDISQTEIAMIPDITDGETETYLCSTPTSEGFEPGKKTTTRFVSFESQYIRTDGGYYWDGIYPATVFINSVDELKEYYRTASAYFDLERRTEVYSDTSIGFLDACDKYDDEYFKVKTLVLVLLQEGSGSIRHSVRSVESDGNEVFISIRRITPQAQTCDMAQWHIFVELNKNTATTARVIIDE